MNFQKIFLTLFSIFLVMFASSCSNLFKTNNQKSDNRVYKDLNDYEVNNQVDARLNSYQRNNDTAYQDNGVKDLQGRELQQEVNPYANRNLPRELGVQGAGATEQAPSTIAYNKTNNAEQGVFGGVLTGVKKFFTFEKATPEEMASLDQEFQQDISDTQNNNSQRARLNLNNTAIETDYNIAETIVNNRNFWLGKLNFPVRHPEMQISSEFGWRRGSFHEGVDLAAPYGSTVEAAHDGKVIYVGDQLGSYGNLVVVQSSQGLVTVYGHNSKIYVNTGDQVHAGQVISLIGTSGDSTGPHLHFEARLPNDKGDYVAVQPKGLFQYY